MDNNCKESISNNMPFTRDYYLKRFNAVELEQLQSAYLATCEMMGRCPITTTYKDEMTREIIQIFECGVIRPDRIAQLMLKVDSIKPRQTAKPALSQTTTRVVCGI